MELTDLDPIKSSINNGVVCCICGIKIQYNSYGMCINCIRRCIDITSGISKYLELEYCKKCERFLQPPGLWKSAKLESRELLQLCLKRIKGLKHLNVVDACFLWTEAHSKRLQVKIIIQKPSDRQFDGIRQNAIINYVIRNRLCPDCIRIEAKDYWRCKVQLRQHAVNKKTYLYLEQLILQHRAHQHSLGIKQINDGLDFYFDCEQHARKFINFLESMVPIKVIFSRRLISHDKQNNYRYYKCNWSAEIAPLSKDSLVCLPFKLRQQLGNLPSLCLVYKVLHDIYLINPSTGQLSEINGSNYFRTPFQAICNPKQLIEFIVMEIEPIEHKLQNQPYNISGQSSQICDIWLVKATQLGLSYDSIHTRTHLGHLLNIGDSVMGYNLKEININANEFDKLESDNVPDVILVRKCNKTPRSNRNRRKLKHLTVEALDDSLQLDNQDFLNDIDNDADLQRILNIDLNNCQSYNCDTFLKSTSNVDCDMLHIGLSNIFESDDQNAL